MEKLSKFWSLARREKLACGEAFVLLLVSQVAVSTIAFKHIDRFLRTLLKDDVPTTSHSAEEIRLVKMSLSRVEGRLPLKALCLSRSITAFIMLRRRGVPAVILAGVKSDSSGLSAHAWVRIGHGASDETSESEAFTVVMSIGDERLDP